MKLFILSCFCILLSGCAVSYLVEKDDVKEIDVSYGCPNTFNVTGHSDFRKRFIDEGDTFRRNPQYEEYVNWIQDILSEQNCESEFTVSEDAELKIHVHEYHQPPDTGQGIGIMAMLTLYLIPLKSDFLYRDIIISYKGESITHTLYERGWVGWYFLPIFPLSFLPYDKYFLEEKLKITLDAEE